MYHILLIDCSSEGVIKFPSRVSVPPSENGSIETEVPPAFTVEMVGEKRIEKEQKPMSFEATLLPRTPVSRSERRVRVT